MSTDSNCIHIVKGTVYYHLKIGKEKIASARTLDALEQVIRDQHDANVDYLTAVDIARAKNRQLTQSRDR